MSAQEINPPVNDPNKTMNKEDQGKKPAVVGRADTRFDPSLFYDGPMFLNDRPIYLDPEMVPVTEVTRILGPAGLLQQTRPLPKNYNKFYNQGQPYS